MQEIQTRGINLVAIGEQMLFKAMKLMKSLSKGVREEDQGLSSEAFRIRRMGTYYAHMYIALVFPNIF